MSDTKKDKKDISVNSPDEVNFRSIFASFLKNEHHTFVVQKTEKLASALYIVTGFIPNEDPLKTRLRTCALELISTSTDPDHARAVRYHEGFASRCLEIGSILGLAQRAGFVSPMNARVLCDEYADLALFVKNHQDRIFGQHDVHVGDDKGPTNKEVRVATPQVTVKDKEPVAAHQVKKTNNYKRHLSRKDIILSLLDIKDKINIKDAMQAIHGCSEKTVQRELISMVQEGVLLKEGERRWSSYRKAKVASH
ncbi:MAG: hypothetical protein AAB439_01005 [Patescibacteria group bacterium]